MGTEQTSVVVPEFDTADRMRKALRTSGVGVQDMADYLGVARNTVSTWINGRIQPSTQTLRLWALRTGVPYEWLQHGTSPEPSTTARNSPKFNTERNAATAYRVKPCDTPTGMARAGSEQSEMSEMTVPVAA